LEGCFNYTTKKCVCQIKIGKKCRILAKKTFFLQIFHFFFKKSLFFRIFAVWMQKTRVFRAFSARGARFCRREKKRLSFARS